MNRIFVSILASFLVLGVANGQEQISPERIGYSEIEKYPWSDVLTICGRHYPAPATANYPIQAAHSPDLIYVNGVMGIIRLRVIPDADHRFYKEIERRDGLAIQPLFGEYPSIPDRDDVILEVKDHRLPLITERYQQGNILYTAHYCAVAAEGGTIVATKMSAENLGKANEKAVVWIKPSVHRTVGDQEGQGLLTNHYSDFIDDKNHLFPARGMIYDGGLLYYGARFGEVDSGSFVADWPDPVSFSEEEKIKWCGEMKVPYQESLMPDELSEVLRMTTELKPGESKSFEFKFLADFETPRRPDLLDLDYATLESRAASEFLDATASDAASLRFDHDHWTEIFNSLHKEINQLTIQFPGKSGLVPTQGSNSQYHYVWMWEAMFMMKPLVRTGHDVEVRRVLDYILSFQDRFAPEGQFHSLDGAIGSNAICWANSTGCALLLAADYCRYSQDRDFLNKNRTALERAASWILGEIQTTRKLGDRGKNEGKYGIMPFARGCDGTIGYNLTLTDGYTWAGLDRITKLITQTRHCKGDQMRKDVDLYREDILAALNHTTDERGFVRHQLETNEPGELLSYEFESSDGVHQLVYCGVVSPKLDWFRTYLDIYERELTNDCFFSPFDADNMYLGTGELDAQIIYYLTGQWKKAFMAVQTILLYGMTEETHLLMERYRLNDPYYLPFQPNGSQTGRLLDMMLNSIVFEWPDETGAPTLTLLPGIPWQWLRESPDGLALTDLRLAGGGRLSLTVHPLDENRQEMTVKLTGPELPRRFRIPSLFHVAECHGLNDLGQGWYEQLENISPISFTAILTEGEK